MLLVYRIIAVVFVCSMPGVSTAGQGEHLVSLRCENQSLRMALNEIRQQTGTHFVFKDSLVDRISVTCDIDRLPIKSALDFLLADSPVDFSFATNNLIVLVNRNDNSRITSYILPPKSYLEDSKTSRLPVLKFRPATFYPPKARHRRVTGTVQVDFLVTKEGNIKNTKITKSSGDAIFDYYAKEYCSRLKYFPAMQHDVPVSVWMSWVFKYGLSKKESQLAK